MPSVCAVVVTFNRKALLRDCLASLLAQTRPVEHVLVVDNHSTDGTPAMVREEFPAFSLLCLPENAGGAGGFHAGMKWAHEKGYDWLWVMDDDIEMLPDALERMLALGSVSGFINVRRQGPEGVISLEAIWDVSKGTPLFYGRDVSFERSDREWIPYPFGNFEGPLIHRSVVDKAGLPDPRFFIAGDDTMYGYCASFYTNVIYARLIGVRRKLPLPVTRSRMNWYLLPRNRFLVREHLQRMGVLVERWDFAVALVLLLVWGTRTILREPKDRWLNLSALWQGWNDGRQGRFGRPPWIPA